MYKFLKSIAISICLVMSFVWVNPIGIIAADDSTVRPEGWTKETHGKKADPNYSVVFPDNKVNRIDIAISSSNFKSMENNLKTINLLSGENPIYVPATVKFNNITWTNVGVRYKGQSSLRYPKDAGDHKYPLHIKFDEYEDKYPEIKDQRFYGFKHLLLGNNWFDSSFLRDKVTSDIFRSAGVPTARGSFYRVFVNTGSGPVYWGLYTGFESPDDEMLNTQFANGDGNMYKGQNATGGNLATFNKSGYEKKTNEDADDWSDLQAVVKALNASRTDAAKWRANLEAVFNVNLFIKWLAINTSITNFDTYGWIAKNHYLYQDLADNGRMVYIPWDFNLSLTTDPLGIMGKTNAGGGFGGIPGDIPGDIPGGGFGGGFGGIPGGSCTEVASLSLDNITKSWPLIRYLIEDPVYKNIYLNEMKAAMSGCFNESTIVERMTKLHELIRPYIVGAEGETSKYSFLSNGTTQFDQGLTELTTLVKSRHKAVDDYLATVKISPTPVTTSTPAATPTTTPTITSINTPTATPINTPTSTFTATPVNTPTDAPTNTATATPANTPTDTPTSTSTATPVNTPTDTPTSTSTATPANTPTDAPTNTATATPINTPSDTPTNTFTATPVNTPTDAPTNTATATPANTPTDAPTSTFTATPANTPTTSIEDINNDGAINMLDVVIIARSFNTVIGSPRFNILCDLNKDGCINMVDIVMLAAKFNTIVRR